MEAVQRLLDIMAVLRDPRRGCPWDREQTLESLVPHTLEEAYEVADAVARGDREEIRDELGDLLFQVVFYSQIASEAGWADFSSVADAIADKLVRRHPHVFAAGEVATTAEQARDWEAHKQREREVRHGGVPSALAGVARALPALTRAVKLQRRAARVGFDWREVGQVLAKVEEELDEVRLELGGAGDDRRLAHEIGDLLLAVSNLARHCGVDPEAALRAANDRFEGRFHHMEKTLARRGLAMEQCAPEQLELLWEAAKVAEAGDPAERGGA